MRNTNFWNLSVLLLVILSLILSVWGSYAAEWRLRDLRRAVTDMTVTALNHEPAGLSRRALDDLGILLVNRDLKRILITDQYPHIEALLTAGSPLPVDTPREEALYLYRELLNYTDFQLRQLESIEILLAGTSVLFTLIIFSFLIQSKNRERLSRTMKGLNRQHQEELEELKSTISSEIHDKIIQDLALLKIGSDAGTANAEAIRAGIEATIDDLRRLITMIQPWDTHRIGLVFSLEMMCKRYAHSGNIRILKSLPLEEEIRLGPRAKLHIVRILQELLSNAVRHSGASLIQITMQCERDNLRISLIDNGSGFRPDKIVSTDAFGLVSLKERSENLGGSCRFDSRPGAGTRIIITIPMEDRDA